jgi:hypothetical protein
MRQEKIFLSDSFFGNLKLEEKPAFMSGWDSSFFSFTYTSNPHNIGLMQSELKSLKSKGNVLCLYFSCPTLEEEFLFNEEIV